MSQPTFDVCHSAGIKTLPAFSVLRQELNAYLPLTSSASNRSTYWKRLRDFLEIYPRPQTFFNLDITVQYEQLATQLRTITNLSKVFAFLWLHDYARPSFEFVWSVNRLLPVRADARRLWATELLPFREMAAQIGYSTASIHYLENRVIEIFVVTGKRHLSDLDYADLQELYHRVDKAHIPDQVQKQTEELKHGVKCDIAWTLRGLSKVLMAMNLPGFDAPFQRRFSVESTPLEEYFEPIENPLIRNSLIDYCKQMSTVRRPGTIMIYRRALLDFALYIQRAFPEVQSYAELHRVPHIAGWLQHCQERHTDNALAVKRAGFRRPKVTTEGRRKIIYYVSSFLTRLALWEHPNAPTRILFDKDDTPRREEPLPFALEEEQAQRIIEAARKSTHLLGKVATLMLLRTGMRMGEFVLLEKGSFVRRKDPASGREITWVKVPIIKLGRGREVPLAFEDVEEAVQEWNAHRPLMPLTLHPRTGKRVEFWLAGGKGYGNPGQPITYHAVKEALDQIVVEAGLNPKEIWPHRYRHTLGTLLINQSQVKEATVSSLLGHDNHRTMTSRYAKIKNQTLLNDMEKLHDSLDQLFPEDAPLEVESAEMHQMRLSAQRAWRDQGYCFCTRNENTYCIAEESCLKCELAAFRMEHLDTLKRMAADAEGKGQVKRLKLLVTAIQKAQQSAQAPNALISELDKMHHPDDG